MVWLRIAVTPNGIEGNILLLLGSLRFGLDLVLVLSPAVLVLAVCMVLGGRTRKRPVDRKALYNHKIVAKISSVIVSPFEYEAEYSLTK